MLMEFSRFYFIISIVYYYSIYICICNIYISYQYLFIISIEINIVNSILILSYQYYIDKYPIVYYHVNKSDRNPKRKLSVIRIFLTSESLTDVFQKVPPDKQAF